MPVWQKGVPQSMQRAACSWSAGSGRVQVELVPVLDALERLPVERQLAR